MNSYTYANLFERLKKPSTYNIRAGVIVCNVTNANHIEPQFLLIKGISHTRPRWGFPKGLKDPDETNAIITALREFEEETGVRLTSFDHDTLFHDRLLTYIRDDIPEISFFLLVITKSKPEVVIQPSEISDYTWGCHDALAALDLTVPSRYIIAAVIKNKLYDPSANPHLKYLDLFIQMSESSTSQSCSEVH
jgi:8-oxo-dGTP pyrophosphatase MutT (NUDIX family)